MDANAQALAEKLHSQGTVKVVFLNGCATAGQVRFFHDAGIPFVIATSREVAETQSCWVATQVYQYFALGRTLQQAFTKVVTGARL